MSSTSKSGSQTNLPKQRLMGAAENALIETSRQHQGHMKVGEILHLQGPYLSLETLTTAVGRLQRRHPFLRSRLQNNPAKLGTYLLEEDDTLHPRILEFSRKHDDRLTFWRQEWQNREKESATVGQGLIEFWLLQDPNDREKESSSKEIAIICEHSICDGLSLSTIAHELLLSLSEGDIDMFATPLNCPLTMEDAVRRSYSTWNRVFTFSKSLVAILRWRVINRRRTARLPLAAVDFPLADMAKHSYTDSFYGRLNKQQTKKLMEKCRQESVTVTSAVSTAILCSASTLVSVDNNQETQLVLAIAADTRRRYVPPMPNHDLSYQVSGTMAYALPTNNTPTVPQGMWQLAKVFGHHVKASVDAGQTLALAMIMGILYQKSLGPPNLAAVPTCGISNWGLLPFQERYGQWELTEMTPFVNMIRAPMPFLLVQTVNGVLTIGCNGSRLEEMENVFAQASLSYLTNRCDEGFQFVYHSLSKSLDKISLNWEEEEVFCLICIDIIEKRYQSWINLNHLLTETIPFKERQSIDFYIETIRDEIFTYSNEIFYLIENHLLITSENKIFYYKLQEEYDRARELLTKAIEDFNKKQIPNDKLRSLLNYLENKL
ncbi:hypothetical protein I4U23_015687 [Adineta vaga]|nr:hypothetical protein I4U23_015687 [Adineta vaga]